MTYLAKDGKVSGPFENDQIQALKASGSFYEYEWMWDGQAPDWTPVPRRLKSPPPLPTDVKQATGPKAPPPPGTPKAPRPAVDIITSNKLFPAIVFDNRQSVGGEVSHAHARGGKFVSTPNAGSHFPKGATVFVDLLDEEKDRTAKVKATITSVSRMDTRWVFEMEWPGLPLL